MQIHELNTFSGTPGANDYFATDNGADTSKISAADLYAPLNARIDNIIAGPAPSAEEIVDARLGADGVTYSSLGDAIRDQVGNLKSDLNQFKDGYHNLNLFADEAELLYENGYATIVNGKISPIQPSTNYNAYLLPVDGESIYTFTNCRFAFLVDSDKETAIGSLLQNVTQVNSTGASYICFSFVKTTYPIDSYIASKGTKLQTGFELPAWSDTFQNQIDAVDSRVYSIEYNSGVNLFGHAELLSDSGYGNIANGKLIITASSAYSAYLLPVDGSSVYTFTNCRFAFLVASDKETVIGSMLQNVTQINSTGASYICFSFDHNTFPVNSYEIYGIRSATRDKQKYKSVTGNLASGDNMQLLDVRNNLRKGERIVFEGNISSFDSLRIGLSFSTAVATDANQINTFRIDGTNISYYARSTSTPVVVAHGLSIADNIQIIWEMADTAVCKFTLFSGGNMFEHDFTNFVRQSIGNPFVLSVDTVLTECKLTWTCVDLIKDIWMFGDSYFAYDVNRWTYYLHQYGYDKHCLLDGYPGEGGTNGRVSFNNLLTFGTPKYAVWCLGMNDTSDSSTAPSTNWVTARDYFLLYCTQNNVTPIFGTIPTVPTINHEQKNAWIRSSGYRYIDFAKAVGASASGVWHSGMLSSDGVHPTAQGARALFARVLLDLPEVMVDDFDY